MRPGARIRAWRVGGGGEPPALPAALAETLGALAARLGGSLHRELSAAVLEPRLVDASAIPALTAACEVYGWAGDCGSGALLVDAPSAQAWVGAALGACEPPRGGPLSPLEHEVLARIVAALLPALRPLCGEVRAEPAPRVAVGDVFLEFAVGPAPAGSLALTLRPPALTLPGPAVEVESLAEVPMTLSVEFARGVLRFGELVQLARGDVLVLDSKVGAPAVLKVGGQVAFTGEAGSHGGRAAFAVGDVMRKVG